MQVVRSFASLRITLKLFLYFFASLRLRENSAFVYENHWVLLLFDQPQTLKAIYHR
jgi:hypothetical protein